MTVNLWHLLERAKASHADRVAASLSSRSLTWRALHGCCVRLAARLAERGVARNDRVALLARNGIEYFCCYFAVARLGAVLVPLHTRWTAMEIDAVLADSESTLLLHESRFTESLESLCSELVRTELDALEFVSDRAEEATDPVPQGDAAQIYYTSGSTGRAKGVVLSHANVLAHAIAVVAELQLDESDVWGHIAPMFHLADAWATFALTAVGATHAFVDEFDAHDALECLRRDEVTITNLVPTMLGRMLAHEDARVHDYPKLRTLMSGGAPISPTLVREIVETFGCEYVQTYGMTETSPYLTMSLLTEDERLLPHDEKLARVARTGRPFLGTELRVVDEAGREVARDDREVGEVQVRGLHVTRGYWKRPSETEAAFTHDGFLRTGDLATIDATSSIRIVDRKKDTILTGGETVYSTEVEHRLHEHPAVLETAVYGVADESWGERVTAAVVLRPQHGATADELIEFCRAALAAYKTPKRVHFTDALPRTSSGKIRKVALRRAAEDQRIT